jgi:excisionase family DNA binding protein
MLGGKHDDTLAHDARRPLRGADWLNVHEAARWLGLGRTSIYALLDEGQIWAVHVGRRVFIPVEALSEYRDRKIGEARSQTSSEVRSHARSLVPVVVEVRRG